MIKHSGNAQKAHADLQVALDRMLKVLKNLNDSLHVVGLKGFPVSVWAPASVLHGLGCVGLGHRAVWPWLLNVHTVVS